MMSLTFVRFNISGTPSRPSTHYLELTDHDSESVLQYVIAAYVQLDRLAYVPYRPRVRVLSQATRTKLDWTPILT